MDSIFCLLQVGDVYKGDCLQHLIAWFPTYPSAKDIKRVLNRTNYDSFGMDTESLLKNGYISLEENTLELKIQKIKSHSIISCRIWDAVEPNRKERDFKGR